MPSQLLNDKSIKAAIKMAVVAGQPKRIADGDNLYLEARPNGAGWWRLRYRSRGKEGMISLGIYPDVSLADARGHRDEARKAHAAGVDPGQRRRAAKVETAGTFEETARLWNKTAHSGRVTPAHAARTLRRLEQMVFPYLGARPLTEIEAPELLAVLRRIETRGVLETTHRVRDACGQVFRFGIASGLCQRNPAADLRDALRPTSVRHHAAITDPRQVAALLRAIDGYVGQPVTVAALKLSALLFLRPGELRRLEWAWIDGDTLTIPSEAMKRSISGKLNGAPHIVPLASQAQSILDELRPLTGRGRYVFPALTTPARHMSENTVRAALRRMGYSNDEMTAHGFRAMARTIAAEQLGVLPDIIEAQLAHAVPDALGRAYNRTQYLAQRRELMQRWADYLEALRHEQAR
ncbi:MAG: integrase arm-type DNA-binding domain-containing protein [Hyphomonadaceae bacterium]